MAEKVDAADEPTPEEREEAQEISRARAVEDAVRLLRRVKNAVLCTLSKKHAGYPFGSVAPYALDARGEPIIYISTIAEHTKNVDADPRSSVFVQDDDSGGDAQAHGRLTLLGKTLAIAREDVPDARARYLARVPSAASYADTHDFAFYRLSVEHARFIGGFGRIFWLNASELVVAPEKDPLAEGRTEIIEHMNEDHSDAIVLYCRAFKGVTPARAVMTGVDRWGFDVQCTGPDVRLRFDFDEPVTMETIRPVVVAMVKKAREILKP